MKRMWMKTREQAIHAALLVCALISVMTTVGIIWMLAAESWRFFFVVSPAEFFFGTRWAPLLEPRSFGVLPLLCGTMMIGGGALVVAVPIGLCSALYLSEYAGDSLRSILKPLLEVLAGIPTVVYGFFALTFVTPYVLRPLFPDTQVFNAASAAIVVGIMIVPTVASLCDDAFRAVPLALREGAYALAATRLEVSLRVVMPASLSGVVAAILLAFSRAVGETMAVAIAAGMTPQLTLNPLASMQTMTAYIVQVSLGDTPYGSIGYQTMFAVGMALFVITLLFSIVAQRILASFREAYE